MADRWVDAVQDPDKHSGFVTKLQRVTSIVDPSGYSSLSTKRIDQFDPTTLQPYGRTVCQDLLSEEQLQAILQDSVELEPLLAEIDTGHETIVALLQPDEVTELAGMSKQQMKETCRKEMSRDAHLNNISPQIVGNYCQVIEYPREHSADLVVMNTTDTDARIPVTATILPTKAGSTGGTEPTTPARRATLNEITDTTSEFVSDRSIGSSGSSLLPTGERASRVCTTGVLTEPIECGTYIKRGAVLHDPFGDTISVYQTDSSGLEQHFDRIDFPATIRLIGEIETVRMDDGEPRVVLILEQLTEITTATAYLSLLETCHHTVDRIAQFNDEQGISLLSRYRYQNGLSDQLRRYEQDVTHAIELLT